MWVIFALLDLDPDCESGSGYGSRDPIESGSRSTAMLSLLTFSALVYEPKCGGMVGGCGVSANEYSCAHLAQINFGDLTPCTYLTYDS